VPPRVVALGDANVDLITRLVPACVGGVEVVRPITEIYAGGSVANTAVCLSRLGCRVAFIGKTGDDAFGRFVRDDFTKEGVDTRYLSVSRDFPTVVVLVFLDRAGERQISLWPARSAAHTQLRPQEIDAEALQGACWLHASGLSLREEPARSATLSAFRLARSTGVRTSLDLNLRMEFFGMTEEEVAVFRQAVELTDVLFGSASEEIAPLARMLGGQSAAGPRSAGVGQSGDEGPEPAILEACGALGAGRRIVVARRGARGALVVTPEDSLESPAFDVPVVDTTGSGDAFNGGFLAALCEGRHVSEAARWGNAAAAMNVMGVGARGVLAREAFDRLLLSGGPAHAERR